MVEMLCRRFFMFGSSQKPLVIVGLPCPALTPELPMLMLPALGLTHLLPRLIRLSSLDLTSPLSSSSSIGTSSAGMELATLDERDESESARGRVVTLDVLERRREEAAARAMGEV